MHNKNAYTISGIGHDSHRFGNDANKPLILGGIVINGYAGLAGNSDADVVLHALCNALSSISGKPILGEVADKLCKQGITDSAVYVRKALATLRNEQLVHVAVCLECSQPKIQPHINDMRQSIANLCSLGQEQVGITASSGEQLTAFGKGEGIQAFVVASVLRA